MEKKKSGDLFEMGKMGKMGDKSQNKVLVCFASFGSHK